MTEILKQRNAQAKFPAVRVTEMLRNDCKGILIRRRENIFYLLDKGTVYRCGSIIYSGSESLVCYPIALT